MANFNQNYNQMMSDILKELPIAPSRRGITESFDEIDYRRERQSRLRLIIK